jgi:hypothetical protein
MIPAVCSAASRSSFAKTRFYASSSLSRTARCRTSGASSRRLTVPRPRAPPSKVERTAKHRRATPRDVLRRCARLLGTAQLSVRQVQYPNRQARGVGRSAIIRKEVGAKVRGERHVYRGSEGDVCILPSGVWNDLIRSPLSRASNALTPWSRAARCSGAFAMNRAVSSAAASRTWASASTCCRQRGRLPRWRAQALRGWPQSIEAFEFAPFDPAQHGRSVDEEYPLDMGLT